MKQGILITAYKNFDHLYDIANYFDNNFEIYIHLDKKQKISKKEFSRLQSLSTVKLISRKYKVNWGGLNHLRCILYLSKEAIKNNALDTFHLISGHDFPIKSTTYFLDFFEKNKNIDYLDYVKLPYDKWRENGFYRLKYYHLYDMLDGKKYRSLIFKLVEFQKKHKIIRPITKKTPALYGGETWWSLSRETLEYVLNYTKTKPYLLRRFKYSFCSEEIYIHTVIMNSSHALKVMNNNLRFIDWEKRNGNFPANLDVTDLEAIKVSENLFARKFEFPVSGELKQVLINNK